jgi:hypothetical protein
MRDPVPGRRAAEAAIRELPGQPPPQARGRGRIESA